MKHPVFQYVYVFYSFVFITHIANIFIDSQQVNYIIGVFAILMVLVSFASATRLFKILSGGFFLIGGYLYFSTGQSLVTFPHIMTSNMSLLTLLAMLPWMNSVVRSGRFDRSLNMLMKVNVSDMGKLYTRSSATTLTLATFLNLSAATISQDVLKNSLSRVDKKLRDTFISASTLRGFSLALLWSPLEILLAVSLFITGVSYVSILPWLLMIAVITFALDSVWGRYRFRKYAYQDSVNEKLTPVKSKALKGKIIHLSLALISFLVFVISIGSLFKIDFILTVTLLIFPYSVIWSFIMKRFRSFWIIGWTTWKMKTNSMQNFIILFISLSLFSHSISSTNFLDVLQKPLLLVSGYPIIVFFIIQLIFIAMSMFGIHPIAIIGILTSLITTLADVFNPLSLAIVLVTSSIATLTVSTYGLVVTLTAMSTEQSPYRITLNNLPYALVFGSVGTIVAYLLL